MFCHLGFYTSIPVSSMKDDLRQQNKPPSAPREQGAEKATCGYLFLVEFGGRKPAEWRGSRRISTGECAAHIALQTFFFADVVDALVLFFRGRALERRPGAFAIPHNVPAVPAPCQRKDPP